MAQSYDFLHPFVPDALVDEKRTKYNSLIFLASSRFFTLLSSYMLLIILLELKITGIFILVERLAMNKYNKNNVLL